MTIVSTGITTISPWTVAQNTTKGAGFTVIQNAINSASAAGGGTVYIYPGTYTESLTLAAGVSLIGSSPGDLQNAIIISGNHTFSGSGISSLQNLTLSASSGDALIISGANNSVVQINNCAIAASSGHAVTGSSTNLNSNFVANNSKFTGSLSGLNFSGSSGVSLTNCSTQCITAGNTAFIMSGSNAASVNNSSFFMRTTGGVAINGVCVSIGAGCSISSNKCSYSAGSGSSAAFYFPALLGTASSIYDSFVIQDPSYYAKAAGSGFGTLAYSYTTIVSGASVIDPNITVTTFQQRPSFAAGGITTWQVVSGATQAISSGTGYIVNGGAGTTFTLPSSPSVGDVIAIVLNTGGVSWTISQSGSQRIRVGVYITTAGSGGSLSSYSLGDAITLVCTTAGANSTWISYASQGNLLIS